MWHFKHNDHQYKIRTASNENIDEVALLISEAYSMWSFLGRKLHTKEHVEQYMLIDGYVVHAVENDELCATFCMRDANPEILDGNISVNRPDRTDTVKLLNIQNTYEQIDGRRFLYLYGLTVTSKLMQKGLGRKIFDQVLKFGKEHGFHGILLETGKDTGWLLEWYLRLGFEIIGEGTLHGTNVRTVMMLKML